MLGESISVMIASNELRSMEQADVLVSVPLQKYNALDYGAADAIIKAGYDAAATKAKVLSTFSVSEASGHNIWLTGWPGERQHRSPSLWRYRHQSRVG